MEFSIRAAREEDAEAIVELLNPIIRAGLYTIMDEPLSVEDQIEFIREFPQRGVFHVAVSNDGQRVVGLQDVQPLSAEPRMRAIRHVGDIATFVALDLRRNGIGRVDLVENRFVGMKSRGVYETPGGTILRHAHMAMESITMDREVMHIRDSLVPKYAELVYYGFWFSPEMKLLSAMIDETQQTVSGTVRLELYKGNCRVLGRKSDQSLYRHDFATFEEDEVYRQEDAEGFIRLNGLRLKIARLLELET